MDAPQPRTNYFVRVLICMLCIFLTGMIVYKFLFVQPRGAIDNGVLVVIGFIVTLVLSESFDNFSLGKIISISRLVRKQEKDIEKLEKQNENLLAQVVSISATQSQNQSHLNVYGDYHFAPPEVTQATEEEVEQKNQNEEAATQSSQPSSPSSQSTPRATDWRKAEEIALNKYVIENKLNRLNMISDAKLSNRIDTFDPISTHSLIFDAFMKKDDREIFIEFRPDRFASSLYRDRLYVMLSKIAHYSQTKNVDACLELVIMKFPSAEAPKQTINKYLESFAPAIASGLLRIMELEFTEQEYSEISATS